MKETTFLQTTSLLQLQLKFDSQNCAVRQKLTNSAKTCRPVLFESPPRAPLLDMSASRLSSTPTTRQPSTSEINRYLSQLEEKERQMALELKAQQAAYSGTLNLETWKKERAAAKWSEEMDFRPPHALSCPSPPKHGDDRDRSPPRLIREENDEDVPGDHYAADLTDPMALLIKEQQLQRETSEKNMSSLIQTMQASLEAMHASQQNRVAMEAVPQCAPMRNKEDILDYLQIFENTQQARGLLRANWAYSLLPLPNQQCRQIANALDPALNGDYTSLKAKLISKIKLESQHPTKSWWEWDKPGQETWQEAESILRKKLKRCPDELFEALLTEKLLQLMPYKTQQYVRDLRPKDASKAAELASSHFQAHHWDESKYATNNFKKPVDISKDKRDKDNYRDHNKDRLQRPNNQHRQWGPHSHHNIYSHKSHAQQLQRQLSTPAGDNQHPQRLQGEQRQCTSSSWKRSSIFQNLLQTSRSLTACVL